MTLIHGAGVRSLPSRIVRYSRPSSAKPPSPLKNSISGRGKGVSAMRRRWRASGRRGAGRLEIARAIDLFGEGAAVAMQHGARGSLKQIANFRRNQIGAQHEHGAARVVACDPGHRLVHAHQRIERGLQILHIGRGPLVQNHQIDRKLFQPPIFMRAQKLAHEFQIVLVLDADQHDRQIAGNPVRPERRYLAPAALENVGRRAAMWGRNRGRDWRGAGTDAPRPRRCRDGEAASAPASRRASLRARTPSAS